MNKIDKEIDILNKILNRMTVKGFYFMNILNKISLCIPYERTAIYTTKWDDYIIGVWDSLSQLFSKHHRITIRYLLKRIDEANKRGTNELYGVNHVDYLGININGLRFLKLMCGCSSHKEFMMKIELMGY